MKNTSNSSSLKGLHEHFNKTHLRLILIFALICIQGYSQIEKQPKAQKWSIGIRPTIKHINLFYQHRLKQKVSLMIEAGYEFRYIPQYERFTIIRMGLLPVMASEGILLETGLLLSEEKREFLFSFQYKFSHILRGTDTEWGFSNNYSRDDHKTTLKILWMSNPKKAIQLYAGSGLRFVQSFEWPINNERDYDSPASESRFWFSPTLHCGIRLQVVRQ